MAGHQIDHCRCCALVPATLSRLDQRYPQLQIELVQRKGRHLQQPVRAAGVDMAIVPHPSTTASAAACGGP
ncbi:hypothetical protein D3C71_1541320 [compost metagenome]